MAAALQPALQPDRIDIWQIPLTQPTAVLARLHILLSPDEQSRAARFLYPLHRNRYIIAHAALRAILAAILNVSPASLTFEQGPYGKPCLSGHPLHFNLTHAGDLALIAISTIHRVGIDLEPIRELPDALTLAEQFHPNELATLRADFNAFFTIWTRKEAFVKATGEGLSLSLASFDTTAPIPGWHLLDIPIPDHAATLATEAINPALHMHTWQPETLTHN